jgi:hypoxanthine phosphoribosyltransferase
MNKEFIIGSLIFFLPCLYDITSINFIVFWFFAIMHYIFCYLEILEQKKYLYPDYDIPDHIKNNSSLLKLFQEKTKRINEVIDNCYGTINQYVLFNFLGSDMEKIYFKDIETIIQKEKTKFDDYDLIIGIETGGALLCDYINLDRKNKKKCIYLNLKARSGNSTLTKFIYALIPSVIKPNIIWKGSIMLESEFKTVLTEYKNKKILLFDDSIYSGKTIEKAKQYIETIIGNDTNIDVYTIYLYNKNFNCEYYEFRNKIKMNWPWGYECD